MLFVVLLVIYIAFMIVLGFIASKRANDIQGYATSHGDVGPFQTALTFAACFASAGTFLGLAGQGYAYGITNVWFWASQWTTCGIILAIVVKRYRKTTKNLKCVSIADWIGDRYKSQGLRAWLAVISVFQILYISSQLVGVGIILNQMIPAISYKMGVFIAAVVIVIYISMGGTYAHIYTNVAQGFMMLIISLVVLISGFVLFGNIFTEVPARLAEVDPNLAKGLNPTNAGYPTAIHVIGLFMAHFWWALNPQLINKATYLKTNRDIKKFILYNALFMFLFGTVVLGGSFCRILYPAGLGAAGCPATMDGAIPLYITTVFPTIMAAIFLVAIIAATMSTVDGILLYVSTVCGNTVYRELYIASKRKRGEAIDEAKVDKTTLLIMKVSVFVVGLIAAPIAFSKPANLTAMLWGAAGPIMSAVAGPLVVGLYIKNTSAKAAALGSVVGAASFIAMYFGKLIPSVYLACGIGGIVSIVFVLIGNTIFKPMEPEHVALVFNELEQD